MQHDSDKAIPYSFDSAVQVIKRALDNSPEIERVTVTQHDHAEEASIEVAAHLADGQRFRVFVTVS